MFVLRQQQYLKYIRLKKWVVDPHCKYCGVETILPEHCQEKGKAAPPHMATIDHKYSRFTDMRYSKEQELILCCNLCNNYRAQVEEDKIPIEELRARSKRGWRDGKPQTPYVPKPQQPPLMVEEENSHPEPFPVLFPFLIW